MFTGRVKDWRSLFLSIVIATVVAAGCLAGRDFLPFLALSENWVNDLRVARLTRPLPQNRDIVVVTITDDTLAAFPYRSPLNRAFLSDLLRTLERKGARAVGIDILFDQPTEPVKDAELRRTLLQMTIPTVVGGVDDGVGLTAAQLAYMNRFLDGLDTGLALLSRDSVDGKIRSIFLGRQSGDRWVAGFSAALARRLGVTPPAGDDVPLEFYGDPGATPQPFRTYPAHSVRLLPDAWFAGKIVLIGADLSLTDRHQTPFDVRYGRDRGMPGVLIHAHSLAQILDGRKPARLFAWQDEVFVLLFAFVGIALALTNFSLSSRVGLALATTSALWSAGFSVYQHAGIMFPLVVPTLALVISAGSQMALRWQRERNQKQFIRDAFSMFLSPSMVTQLVSDPGQLSVGGEKRIVTSLFTDIANFTEIMEKSDPSVMVPVLNNYLDAACRIVHEHGGTIDKIVGDALVVFFNAPMDQPDHADRAVACALELDAFSQSYRERMAADGVELGCTRIGLHTGPAVVGNFGGFERFAYTAYGDTINTAARFESANKYFGTRVCIGAATVEQAARFHFRPIGSVVLKGKTEPVEAFEPIPESEAASAKNIAYLDAYRRLERQSEGAADAFVGLAGRHPDDPLIRFHADRLKSVSGYGNGSAPALNNRIVLGEK